LPDCQGIDSWRNTPFWLLWLSGFPGRARQESFGSLILRNCSNLSSFVRAPFADDEADRVYILGGADSHAYLLRMIKWLEHDWPPEDRGRRHKAHAGAETGAGSDSEVLLHIRARGTRGDRPPRKRSPYDRFLSAYLRVLIGVLRIVAGAALGIAVVLAAWFVVTIIRL
jgi:hypothetical protein